MQERKAAATRGREWEYVLVFLCHCKRRRVAESSFDRRGRGGISIPQRRGEVTSSDLTRQQQLAGYSRSRWPGASAPAAAVAELGASTSTAGGGTALLPVRWIGGLDRIG